MPNLEQHAEGSGRNYHAEGGITFNGLSLTETQRLFEILLESNFPRLLDQARTIAEQRCSELFLQFWEQLKKTNGVDNSTLSEPGVQADIAETLTAYGKSGNQDTGNMLADLLVSRIASPEFHIEQRAASAALPVAAKLRSVHYSALTFLLMLKRTVFLVSSLDQLIARFQREVLPFGDSLDLSGTEVWYMANERALTMDLTSFTFMQAILRNYGGLFVRGLEVESEKELSMVQRLNSRDVAIYGGKAIAPAVIQSELASGRVRTSASSLEDLESIAAQLEDQEEREFFQRIGFKDQLGEQEIKELLIERDIRFKSSIDIWDAAIANTSPTLAGAAIGHANLKRVVPGIEFGLDVWLS
jgi:hypothetical protein